MTVSLYSMFSSLKINSAVTFRSATTFHKSNTLPAFFAFSATFASSAQILNRSSCVIPVKRKELALFFFLKNWLIALYNLLAYSFSAADETRKLPEMVITSSRPCSKQPIRFLQQRALDFEKSAQMKVGAKSFELANSDVRTKMRDQKWDQKYWSTKPKFF